MNAEYINAFVQGAQNTLNAVCGENPRLGNLFLKKYPYTCESVSIVIGIFKDLTGDIIFTMKYDVALFIVSKMMFGMQVAELDDMSKSAISELGNMISGNVATIFSGKGKIIDITPPQFRLEAKSEEFQFIKPDSKLICVPLSFSSGEVFEVNILLQD